jgi:hypothetical protein
MCHVRVDDTLNDRVVGAFAIVDSGIGTEIDLEGVYTQAARSLLGIGVNERTCLESENGQHNYVILR